MKNIIFIGLLLISSCINNVVDDVQNADASDLSILEEQNLSDSQAEDTFTCPLGTNFCNGTCTNLSVNLLNCGTCGNACETQQICLNGNCETCSTGEVVCNNTCANLNSSPNNCGSCGRICNDNTFCIDGNCSH